MSDKHIKPRMHRRIPLKVGLDLTGDFRGSGTILEMSEGGLSFATEDPPAAGARVAIAITDEAGQITLRGEIVHASDRSGEHVAGVRFDAPDAATQAAVRALLKRHRFNNFRVPR
jgi:hypothetical protein